MSTALEKLRAKIKESAKKQEESPESKTPEPATDPLTEHSILDNALAELEQGIKDKVDFAPTILRDIHQYLKKNPLVVTALTDEQVGLIVKGLLVKKQIVLGKTGGKSKKVKQITEDMI